MVIQRALDGIAALAMTILLLFAAPAAAQTFPPLTGRVVDQAHLLSPEPPARQTPAARRQGGASPQLPSPKLTVGAFCAPAAASNGTFGLAP